MGGMTVSDTEKSEEKSDDTLRSDCAPSSEMQDSSEIYREDEAELPEWLDDFIFNKLGAVYSPKDTRYQHTLDLTENEVKVYLGTYFPRSYSEAFCITENLFRNECFRSSLNDDISPDNEINILDIGCGSGGEIIGLLDSLCRHLPPSVRINVYAFDGNQLSLECMEKTADCFIMRSGAGIKVVGKFRNLGSEADLSSVAEEVSGIRFDFILCCKMCSELLSGNVSKNPYWLVADRFSGLLKPNGLLLILDVTIRSGGSWLPVAMNYELSVFCSAQKEFGTLIPKPCGKYQKCCRSCYTKQVFRVKHSKTPADISKVCYRIICRNSLKDRMVPDSVMNVTQVIDPVKYKYHDAPWMPPFPFPVSDGTCRYSGGDKTADGFNINLTPEETRGLSEDRNDAAGTGDAHSNG